MKKCPFCAEEIQDEAIVCRFCGRDLNPRQIPVLTIHKETKKYDPLTLAIVIVLGIIVTIICLASYGGGSGGGRATHDVVYKITGSTSRADYTIQNSQGGTEQAEVSVPWSKTFTFDRGEFVYLSAQNHLDSGSITCEIWVDGNLFKQSTSSGAYVIASCDGLVP